MLARRVMAAALAAAALVAVAALPAAAQDAPPPPAADAAPPPVAPPAPVYKGTNHRGIPQFYLPPGAAPFPVRPSTIAFQADYTVAIGGLERVFRLHVPPGLPEKAPLVAALHGWYQSKDTASGYMNWERLADARKFVVLYPQGHRSSWNAGRCCGGAKQERVDDLAALARMVDLANSAYPVDTRRRYAAGFSNGGMMALSAACRRPDLFAAVLAVSAAHMDPCRPAQPVSVMQVNGDKDATIAWSGAPHSGFLGTAVPAVTGTQSLWKAVNRAPKRTLLVRIVGGGHQWPATTGTKGSRYDTTHHGWAFLSSQAR